MTKWRGNKKVEEPPYVPCDYDATQFTEDEAFMLEEWRERFDEEESLRLQNDPRVLRMEFARWLVAHEVIGEFSTD